MLVLRSHFVDDWLEIRCVYEKNKNEKKKRVFSFKYVGAEQPLGGGLELANHSKVAFRVSVVQFNQCLVKTMNL